METHSMHDTWQDGKALNEYWDLPFADSVSSAGGAYTTGVNLETGDQQPKAASSQDQEQGQKSSPAATVKETASWKSLQHHNLKSKFEAFSRRSKV